MLENNRYIGWDEILNGTSDASIAIPVDPMEQYERDFREVYHIMREEFPEISEEQARAAYDIEFQRPRD